IVEITVADDGNGNLVVSDPVVKKAGSDDFVDEIVFVNTYTPPITPEVPKTGEDMKLWQVLLLISGGAIIASVGYDRKRKIKDN
ncbi:MAG: hypothetical protein ACI3YH_04660, partial [Eubacteriales bacterium]